MKKIFIFIFINILFLFIPTIINASTNTIPRTEKNLGIRDSIEVTAKNKQKILDTPKVSSSEKVYDFADILTDEEEEELYDSVEKAIESTKLDIVLLTIDDNNKADAMNYADDFYDYNDFGFNETHDGVLLLIDMDTREIWMSTTGYGISLFNDKRINYILDDVYKEVSKQNYYAAFSKFIDEVKSYSDLGLPNGSNGYGSVENRSIRIENVNWPVSLIGGLIVAIITLIIVLRKHKMIRPAIFANNYIDENETITYMPIDTFLTTHTAVVKIQHDNNSGGGSSRHTGSSGTSHGGGGRSF